MNIYILLFFLGIFSGFNTFSQNKEMEHSFEVLEKLALKTKLDSGKVALIKILIEEREQGVKKNADYSTMLHNNSIMYVWDKRNSKAEIERKFSKGLTEILTKEEYRLFFEPVIEAIAKNAIDQKVTNATSIYKLNKKQQKSLEKSIKEASLKEAFANIYYKYDEQLIWRFSEKTKMETDKFYNEALIKMGYNPIDVDIKIGERERSFVKDAKAVGLSDETIHKVFQLVASQDKKIKDYESNWGKIYATSIIGFYDTKATKNNIYFEFKKGLSELITYEQYKQLFKKHLIERIEKDALSTLNFMKGVYNFTPSQYKVMADLVYSNTFDEICTEEYYSYGGSVIDIKRKERKIQSIKEQKELLTKQGFTYLGEPEDYAKTKKFISKMEKAGVSKSNREKILNAVTKKELLDTTFDLNWSKGDNNDLVQFYFEDTGKEFNKKKFRQHLRELLTKEQFFEIFEEVLQPRIDKTVQKELNNINKSYVLKSKQLKEIENLLYKRYKEEVIYDQYYHYDYGLRDEKINATKYKFISQFKTKMKSYGF